jgi:hypothetical protein
MIASVNIKTGDAEPIEVSITDFFGAPLPGLTTIKARVRRLSDLFYFDWTDNTFRAGGSVARMLEALTPVNPTYSRGEYHLNTVDHPGAWDTSKIANPAVDDIYHVTVIEDGSSLAGNVPQVGEIKVGRWVDLVDVSVSSRASPSEVQAELRSIRLHTLVSVNPGIVPPATGTYVRQILDKEDRLLVGGDVCVLKQSFAYDPIAEKLTGQIWLEKNNAVVLTAVSATVSWFDADGVLLFTMTDAGADPQGFFKVEKPTPGLVRNRSYYSVATVALPGLGNVISGKGALTIG